MTIAMPGEDAVPRTRMEIVGKTALAPDVMQLLLRGAGDFIYQPGQFLKLFRPDGLARNYSIASTPQQSDVIELHIRRMPGGRMSGWLHESVAVGDTLQLGDALGECHYLPGQPEQPLLLIGTGCGLAPLIGVARDALAHGHSGEIAVYHGSRTPDGLYLVDELRKLSHEHPNFHYTPCISGAEVPAGYTPGRADQVALAAVGKLKGWRLYLCGQPSMVASTKKRAFLAGASFNAIHADPFTLQSAGCEKGL